MMAVGKKDQERANYAWTYGAQAGKDVCRAFQITVSVQIIRFGSALNLKWVPFPPPDHHQPRRKTEHGDG